MNKTIKDLKPGNVCKINLQNYYVYGPKNDDDFFGEQHKILILSIGEDDEVYIGANIKVIKFLYDGSVFKTYLESKWSVSILSLTSDG